MTRTRGHARRKLWPSRTRRTTRGVLANLRRPQTLGQRGEAVAARLLRRKGYRIVAGARRSRFGEIDLIAVENKRTVVFVEVKTRRSDRGGLPEETVGHEQQQRIAHSALAFLKSHGLLEHPARFDIIAIVWPKDCPRPTSVKHLENAYEPRGVGGLFG
ncbi:MAG: YraN family protein [Planctomycetales bacterium]|nr:YraN family protein [Planctomycetales bacterium]